MKQINKDALRAQLLAAGMTEEQISATLTASEQDAAPITDPKVLAEIEKVRMTLEKGIKKGDLKIEHEDDDEGDDYEIEAEDDDEAEDEMNARAAAKGMSKAIQTGNVEGIFSELLKTNARLVKSLRQERRIFLAKVEKALAGTSGEQIANIKATLEAQGATLAEIKKGLATPEAPRGRTGATPIHHPAEQPVKPDAGWTPEKINKAIMHNAGGWSDATRSRAKHNLALMTVGQLSPDKVAEDLKLSINDAN